MLDSLLKKYISSATARQFIKTWGIFWVGFFLVQFAFKVYDTKFRSGYQVIGSIHIISLLSYIAFAAVVVMILAIGFKIPSQFLNNLTTSAAALLFFLLVGEIICLILVKTNIVSSAPPTHSLVYLHHNNWHFPRAPFWGDYGPYSGNWCMPHDTTTTTTCTNEHVFFSTNAFGMRDAERNFEKPVTKKRIVMIGDSFMEGHIVDTTNRCSNVLERNTHVQHLNFGINGTSPINYYLTYKHLANKFEHDALIVSILPGNDFEDYKASHKFSLLKYPIYRPYWNGTYPNFKLQYSLASISQSIWTQKNYNNPVHTYQVVDSVYQSFTLKDKILAQIITNSYIYSVVIHLADKLASSKAQKISSFQNQYYEKEWYPFEYSLRLLAKEANGKPILFYTIPIIKDLEIYDANKIDDLSPRLNKLCQELNITYINLLPIIHAKGHKEWEKIYELCDGHWSSYGEKLMADILLSHPEYQKMIK